MLKRDDDSVLRVALDLEVNGKRKQGRPKKTWKKQVKEKTKTGLKKENTLNQAKWRDRVLAIYCRGNGMNLAISSKGTTPNKN